MPSFDLDELVKPATRAEVQASIYDALAIVGVNTTGWKSGAVVRTMIVATSMVLSALSELQAKVTRSGFLELSEGKWLTMVAHYVYDIDRFDATFATGEITLSNSGGGVYLFDPDDLIFAHETSGATYRNTAPVSIAALGTAHVAIAATVAGTGSDAGIGQINKMVTTVLNVTCSNAASLSGSDQETDASVRERCKEQLGALSPMGPWDAYGSAVRNATHPDGTSLGITRIRIVKDGYGTVSTYVANANGAVDGVVGDLTTDLGIADEAIQQNAAPLAVNALTYSAINHPIAVTYEVWMYNTSSLSDAELREAIAKAIDSFFVAQPIGGNVIGSDAGKIFVDGLRAAITDSVSEVFHTVVTVPAADVVMSPSDVAVSGTIVTTAIHQEPPPEGFGGSL